MPYPSLYQINTRVWLTELSRQLGRRATLDDIPEAELERLKKLGFDWIWLLMVWRTGLAGQRISRTNAAWRKEFEETFSDLREEDIGGSGFAVTSYTVADPLGGAAALARLRKRLQGQGLKLLLDFVPNHVALDHPWVDAHPDYFIHGTEADLARSADRYARIKRPQGDLILAYGRDPYFPGWPDTLQLNYGNAAVGDAMSGELAKVACQCAGVRCDMAMLLLPEVFEQAWGIRPEPFWPKAIASVRKVARDFCFMAEVYWGLERALLQQGFDYAYDKELLDRLHASDVGRIREHFGVPLDCQEHLVRFLENHDEPRAAASFPPGIHEAAAVVAYCCPGLRFFHQGQLEGKRKRISPHLVRGPMEPIDETLARFYDRLLTVLGRPVMRVGEWQLLECLAAWEGNWTNGCILAFAWNSPGAERALAAVNFAGHQSQCYVRLPFSDLSGGQWRFADQLSEACYDRDGNDLQACGLYLDLPAWKAHVFLLTDRQ